LLAAILSGLKANRAAPQPGLDLLGALAALVQPADAGAWIQLLAIGVVALVCGLFTAAIFAARQATADPRNSEGQ
jgi:threonine/homoserine/homoserine lactone efflux protein